MRKIACLILLVSLPFLSQADGKPGDKKKSKNQCQKVSCRPKIHSIEEFGFMVPPPSDNSCRERQLYRQAIVNFYQWYLNNQQIISERLTNIDKYKDLLPPFHVSYETLHRFYELIKQKYPEWVNCLVPDTLTTRQPAVQPAVSGSDALSSSGQVQLVVDTLSAI